MIRAAQRRQQAQKRAADAARREARRLWRAVNPGAVIPSWRTALPQMLALLTGLQVSAASTADLYVSEALASQSIEFSDEWAVNPQGLVGYASDGRPLASLLAIPAVQAMQFMDRGMATPRALAFGQASLEMIAATQVSDAFRIADSIAAVTRDATTYVRVLGPNPCSRCIMLAGQVDYRTAFLRHPSCSCSTLPSTQVKGKEHVTDPTLYFESLSEAEQDRVFTKAGAQAIRDGADMNRVVNARRRASGMRPASDYERTRARQKRKGTEWADLAGAEGTVTGRGRLQRRQTLAGERFVTFEDPLQLPGGGLAPRMMPESIYEIARDHEHAVSLLKRHGYIEERQAYRQNPDGTYTRVR